MKMNQLCNTGKQVSWRGVGENCGVCGFPWHGGCSSHDDATLSPRLTGGNPWLSQSKESLQYGIRGCFSLQMKLLANRGFNWNQKVSCICQREKSCFFLRTHTQNTMSFVKINRQPLLWKGWMWTSNSRVKPFQSRVNVIFTPILF